MQKTYRLPTIKDLSALLQELKPTIGDEYRAAIAMIRAVAAIPQGGA